MMRQEEGGEVGWHDTALAGGYCTYDQQRLKAYGHLLRRTIRRHQLSVNRQRPGHSATLIEMGPRIQDQRRWSTGSASILTKIPSPPTPLRHVT